MVRMTVPVPTNVPPTFQAHHEWSPDHCDNTGGGHDPQVAGPHLRSWPLWHQTDWGRCSTPLSPGQRGLRHGVRVQAQEAWWGDQRGVAALRGCDVSLR